MPTPSSGNSLPVRSATTAQRTRCDGRRTVVRLRFANGRITRDSARTWARSLATDLWGQINDEASARLSSGRGVLARAGAYAWWFSCAGHGGYILIGRTDAIRAELARFITEGGPHWAPGAGPAAPYAAWAFEEDCDWAAFVGAYPEAYAWDGDRARQLASAQDSLRRWHLELAPSLGVPAAAPDMPQAPVRPPRRT